MEIEMFFEVEDGFHLDSYRSRLKGGEKTLVAWSKLVDGLHDKELDGGNTGDFLPTPEQQTVINGIKPRDELATKTLRTNFRGTDPMSDLFRFGGLYQVCLQSTGEEIYVDELLKKVLDEGITFKIKE